MEPRVSSRFEVVDGRLSPDYGASHFDRRFLTFAWVLTLPSAAARWHRPPRRAGRRTAALPSGP